MSIQLLHLYPDLMNLYGEYANVAALRRSLERQGAEVVVRTGTLYQDIDFSGADFLYMGAGTESAQLTALEDLRRYESAVRAALEQGAVVLATGNAMELFGSSSGLLYFAFACAISYLLSGYCGLYSSQTILYSKLRAEFINVHAKE